MKSHSNGDHVAADQHATPADTSPRILSGRGHDPRAATGTGIGCDPARIAVPAGTDPAGGPGTAPASDTGAVADYEPDDATVSGPDRHNATEADPSAVSTPPGSGATRPTDAASTT